MNEERLKQITFEIGLRCLQLCDAMPRTNSGYAISRQLSRCGTSVGANYRAACRARSRPEMIARLAVVEEEADETLYWLEMATQMGITMPADIDDFVGAVEKIIRITVSSIRTLRAKAKA
ncbi:four helix bundle protein [bacterium]|nr:MAG: four helix bundle protein [bacterium]